MSSLTAHRSIVGEPEVVEDGALLPKSSTWHELKAAVSELRTLQAADGSIPEVASHAAAAVLRSPSARHALEGFCRSVNQSSNA